MKIKKSKFVTFSVDKCIAQSLSCQEEEEEEYKHINFFFKQKEIKNLGDFKRERCESPHALFHALSLMMVVHYQSHYLEDNNSENKKLKIWMIWKEAFSSSYMLN